MKTDQIPQACPGCDRRQFILKLGTLLGAAAVVPDSFLSATPVQAIPDKKGALKVRLVFSYHMADIQDRPDWPNKGYNFTPVMQSMTAALNAGVRGVEFIPSKANTEEDGLAIVAEDAKTGEISGYMVVQMNCWNKAVFGIATSGKPLLFTALPYAGDGGWLKYNAKFIRDGLKGYEGFCSFDFSEVVTVAKSFEKIRKGGTGAFVEAARKARLDFTPKAVKDSPLEGPLQTASADEALAAVRGMKILSVQKDLPARVKALKKDFGVNVEVIPFEELNKRWDAADEKQAKTIADGWKNGARSVEDVTDDVFLGCARLYLGMKALLAEKKAQAITIDCLHGCYSGTLKSYPCLGFMQLQDDGLFGVCENDLNSTFSMMLGHAITRGRMGYVSDPVLDIPRRNIIYAHCVSTRHYLGADSPQAPYEVLTHSEDREGASVRAIAPIGYPITTIKVDVLSKKIAVHTAIVTGNDPDDRACRTKIVARVTGDFEKIYREWDTFGWHRVSFLGDFAPAVREVAAKVGYELVEES